MCVVLKKSSSLLWLQNSPIFFYESSRLDAIILSGIISKGATKFELKFLQIHSFFVFAWIFKAT
jgi:hypothetical protein